MNPIARLGVAARRGFGRITPEPFVLAVGLTVIVLVTAVCFGDRPGDVWGVVETWSTGSGVWKLLTFGMQASLMLVLGTALAEAPPFQRGLAGLARLPATPRQLVGLTASVSIGLALLNWSLCLIGGALFARAAGERARDEGWQLHYPLLCAAAYAGLMVWHGGLSGTAPLKVTAASDLIEVLGPELTSRVGVIPLERTLFSALNFVVSGGLALLGPLLFVLLTPAEGTDPEAEKVQADRRGAVSTTPPDMADDAAWMNRAERSPLVSWLLIVPMFTGLAIFVAGPGLGRLDLNTVNLALWCAAMLAHGGPQPFLAACERGIRGCTGIFLQFPLYAGIMGVMAASGLSVLLTRAVSGTGAGGLGPVTFLSAGVLNFLVPSGGGQWAVQGPIIVEAALDLGVPVERVLMAMAYGDQWTNMIQPFWALPLLAITGVRARDIVGYTAIWMVVGGAWILAVLALMP